MAEKQSIKKVSKEKMAALVYEATFTSGKVVSFDGGALLQGQGIDLSKLSDVTKGFIAYGIKQKLDDSMAGAADEQEAIEELESTIEALNNGKWTLRVAGEGAGEAGGIFARAFAEARGLSLADAKTTIAGVVQKNQEKNKDASERAILNAVRAALLKKDAKFAEVYNRMQMERAAKTKGKVEIEL
jgi:hypothetical protein